MKGTVAAVVVTYNRASLLAECLNALLNQSRKPDRVIVVDNASTDGTTEMMTESGFLSRSDIEYVRLPENTGGAGGFFEGIRRGYEGGFQWFWIMDDDAEPDADALEMLLSAGERIEGAGFLCSSVVGLDGKTMNTPNVDLRPGKNGYPQWDEYLQHGMVGVRSATFVSVLVAREAVGAVGLPIREMFIWGDDIEYTTRITARFPAYVVGSSRVLHKRLNQESPNVLTEQNRQRISNYRLFFRNNIFVSKRHYGLLNRRFINDVIHAARVLAKVPFAPPPRTLRGFAVIGGLFSGLFFSPKVVTANKTDHRA